MKFDWILAGVLALASLIVLVLTKRRAQPRAWADWGVVSGDLRASMVEWLRVHTTVHLRALSRALRFARGEHERPDGRSTKVREALGEADELAGQHVHYGLVRLGRWRSVTRTLATLRPLPPLPASTLQTPLLRRLAWLQRLGAIPLSEATRFLLGLRIQGWALRVVGVSFDAARRRAAHDSGLAPALARMESGRDDLAALDLQALRIFECLLASLPESENGA